MDFSLPIEIEDFCKRVQAFVADKILPVEADRTQWDAHENISEAALARLRAEAKKAGLWAPQMPQSLGGQGLSTVGMAAAYEEMNRSIFGPAVFNCAAPDDGNMILLNKVATEAQKDRWLKPIVEGRARSAFVMTEPAPGSGSDPGAMMLTRAAKKGDRWTVTGRKWFITGAETAEIFILVARTSDEARKSLTAFLFHCDQPGWRIVRRIPIMGPEEHGGHCELEFAGLEIPDADRLMNVGDGMKATQIRLGIARLTHCMRWLGLAKRALEIVQPYVAEREAFGEKLSRHEGVQWMLGEAAMAIQTGRLLVMHAAWLLDRGERAQAEVAIAKIAVADVLHKAVDTAIQLCGARGYSKDTLLEWIYRYARQARLVDGASEVHKMVLARFFLDQGRDFLAVGLQAVNGDGATEKLETFLGKAAAAGRVRVIALEPLAGGAIQDNRRLLADIDGGAHVGRLDAVLRMDAPSRIAASHDRSAEFAILKCAHAAGVKAPEPLWLCADAAVLGRPFFVMRHVEGTAAGHRLVKDAAEQGYGERLAAELGEELAKIHAISWNVPELAFLPAPARAPALALVSTYRDFLDDLLEPAPAVEWGLAWLERNAPRESTRAFCHRDFRTGNYLVKDGKLAAVLDWEFAGPGDPDEDLGWFLAKCWRFGKIGQEAGGIGARETFVAAYERNAGRTVDRARLGYWEVMAHVRWAVIALQQAARHASGAEKSLELALTAHVVPELELEILDRTREA